MLDEIFFYCFVVFPRHAAVVLNVLIFVIKGVDIYFCYIVNVNCIKIIVFAELFIFWRESYAFADFRTDVIFCAFVVPADSPVALFICYGKLSNVAALCFE